MGTSQLQSIPSDTFQGMPKLGFIHLAVHPNLRVLPSLQGLRNLRILSLAVLFSMERLPDLQDLVRLERLVLAFMPSIQRIDDLGSLKELKSFVVLARSAMCCNGFLRTQCDPSNVLYSFRMPTVTPPTCVAGNQTSDFATEATIKTFARFAAMACAPPTLNDLSNDTLSEQAVARCNATMFTQCWTNQNELGM